MSVSRIKRWTTAYVALKKYRKEHPGEWPGVDYIAPNGLRLGMWCHNQRAFRRRRALVLDRARKLESIGFPWRGNVLAAAWAKTFDAFKLFRQEQGHCRPSEDYVASGVKLQQWCHRQREMKKNGTLSRDRLTKLESIGFDWEPYGEAWARGFEALKRFRVANAGKWPRVIDVAPDGFKLGSWCHKQRKLNKWGILPKDRKRKLDAIGFEWEPEEALWRRGFEAFKSFRKLHPDGWPSHNYLTSEGLRLGSWCNNKRTNIKRGVLGKDHLTQLKKIGFE